MTAPALVDTVESSGAGYAASRLLTFVREDLARADTKASVLLSFVLALPALVASNARFSDRPSTAGMGLLAVGGLVWVFGAMSLVRAILPRFRTERDGPGITFYADVLAIHRESGHAGVLTAVTDAGGQPAAWLVTQTVDLSSILARKYRCIRWGVGWLLLGVVCVTAGLLTV
ncbi:Pycsar system effector family protein [Streptomyces sp. NBC_00690]|uniref:Pycsar system effector family protein n=1 Tax=Streptomyces sp. NBC_00690 TaxID=2975808 RepID=UPI002E28F270|nr:Pycsar system effector family protein [Streptomyces sp. NBC_00690]